MLLYSTVSLNHACALLSKSFSRFVCCFVCPGCRRALGASYWQGWGVGDKTTAIVLAIPCRNESSRESSQPDNGFGKGLWLSPATLHPDHPSKSGQWEKDFVAAFLCRSSNPIRPFHLLHRPSSSLLIHLNLAGLLNYFVRRESLALFLLHCSRPEFTTNRPPFIPSCSRPTLFSRYLLTEYSQFCVCLAARWSGCFDCNFGIALNRSRPPHLSSRLLSHQSPSLPSPSLRTTFSPVISGQPFLPSHPPSS